MRDLALWFFLFRIESYQSLTRISNGSSSPISSPAMILRTRFTLSSFSLSLPHTHTHITHARTHAYSQVFQPPLLHDKRFDDLESVGMLPSRSLPLYHICELLSSSSSTCFPPHPRVDFDRSYLFSQAFDRVHASKRWSPTNQPVTMDE